MEKQETTDEHLSAADPLWPAGRLIGFSVLLAAIAGVFAFVAFMFAILITFVQDSDDGLTLIRVAPAVAYLAVTWPFAERIFPEQQRVGAALLTLLWGVIAAGLLLTLF